MVIGIESEFEQLNKSTADFASVGVCCFTYLAMRFSRNGRNDSDVVPILRF